MTATHLWAGAEFCGLILKSGIPQGAGLYCFNSAGLELMREWKDRGGGGPVIVEQTIAPRYVEERILGEEEERFPGWQEPLPRDANVESYVEREQKEWAAADLILCGSQFVVHGIREAGGPAEKCVVVPYGVPMVAKKGNASRSLQNTRLRVLTVGEVCLRKGSHYLLQVAKALQGIAEFRMLGPMGLLPQRAVELRKWIDWFGVVARNEIHRHYEWADVFLLPSLCEGSATVSYEALAHGLPVIATRSAGSIVEDQISGIIVPEHDSDAIVEILTKLNDNRDWLEDLSLNAKERSAFGTVEAYRDRLLTATLEANFENSRVPF